MNKFPNDFQHDLTGFGGDTTKNQAEHRASLHKTPIILVHGNATNSVDPKYGMQTMKEFLRSILYQDCEIWAMDYLGENNTEHLMPHPHRDKIDVVRKFIDDVRTYLGVDRLDFIAHSLGCGMVNAYLRGLQSNGEWNNNNQRFSAASTFVSLAGATYGLGKFIQDEFQTGGPFEITSHKFKDVADDDTPFGLNDKSKQIAPVENWKVVTALDNNNVHYVAITARGDFVDQQNPDTGRRNGADSNLVFNLGVSTQGHEKIVKDRTVFDAFKDYLNHTPPQPPVSIKVDKESGNYGANLKIAVTVDPANVPANYTAKRLAKSMQGGFLEETVAEANSGTLASGQSLTLGADGAWELVLAANGAEEIQRTYGINVVIPEVTILTDNSVQFQRHLEVSASATKGTVFFSLDKKHWNAGAKVTINETSKVYFIAIDPNGLASPIADKSFEKKPVPQATATLTEHFIAHRINVEQYIKLGQQVGFTAAITLYFINNQWVLDPNTPEASREAPLVHLSADAGVHTSPLVLAITARHKVDAEPRIYFTLDGSMPTENSQYFSSSGLLKLDTAGTRTLKYRARDTSGNWSDVETKTYTMNIKDMQPKIESDKPSGIYPLGLEVVLSASDDVDKHVTVYYTQDGSDPSDAHNPNRHSFVGSKKFSIKGNGHHAVFCYAKDSAGREALQPFAWQIDDQKYPETSLSPSMGGIYVGSVTVELSPSEQCKWTKYTSDGSEPSEAHGDTYSGPIPIGKTTVLKFRSKDIQGNLEPVKTATFAITQQSEKAVFDNHAEKDGHVKADPDGSSAFVGTFDHLAIGSGRDSKDSRTILHFDTSSLPDNVTIDKAYLEVGLHSTSGDAWADGRKVEVDVQQGYFGSSHAIEADDWGAAATAEGVAAIDKFSSGTARSSDFSQAGLEAINKTGATQIRLKINRPHDAPDNCLFLKGGAGVKLVVGYSGVGS